MIRLAVLIVFVAVLMFAFSYSQLGYVRWAEDSCHYSLIHSNDTTVIDLAVFGSSRTMRAVHAPLLATEINLKVEKPWTVYDLSRQQRGMGHNYVMIKELLENREVKTILIEYNISRQKKYHDLFYLKASLADLWFDYLSEQKIGRVKRLGLLARRLAERTSKRWEQALLTMKLKVEPEESKAKPGVSVDCNGYRNSIEPSVLEAAEEKNSEKYFTERFNWDFDSEREYRTSYYVNAIVVLAREYGVEPIFFHSVGRYTSVLDKKLLANFESRFGARILQPEDGDLKRWFAAKSYADTSHMSPVGAAYFAKWLAQRLTSND